ncbi:hypothetical protein RQP58_08390 [Enterobacter asburiae]|uniref:hypothetical protein n=1 Tax=Enterobacter asburiae TaxID=61645 RepID=UPI0028EFCD54|nr:hypothetical protein [Enterobacter asburiae]WNS34705.1 hypothetical protein RQP58_08390 [Enterobacter asburiae]
MSPITKEFTKEQLIERLQHRISVASGFPESEKAQMDLELARIALASLEAEAYGYVHKAAYEQAGSCGLSSDHEAYRDSPTHIAVYTVPPAPVSVPDEDLLHMAASAIDDLLSNKDRYCAGVWADIPAKLRRAAMLQGARNHPEDNLDMVDHSGDANEKGNSPVIPDGWVLVPVEPTEDMIVNGFESEPDESFSDEREWEAYDAMSGCQQAAHRARLCWAAMLAAAPRPEA